jgi:hypothetical protein
MGDVIREAGWPIYSLLILGFAALAVSIRHAAVPQRSLVPLALALTAACLVNGALGMSLGLHHTIDGIRQVEPERRWIFLIGLSESMNNWSASLVFALPALLACGIGSYRLARRREEIDARK